MAYTITEPNNQYLPAENIAWVSADSTDKNEESFVYRYRLQVTGANDTFTSNASATGADVVGTFRTPPRPVSGIGNFSPSAVAKTYVTTPLEFPNDYGGTGEGLKKYRIIYGQEYETGSGLTGSDEVTGSTQFIWNGVWYDEAFPNYNEDSFVIKNYSTPTSTFLLTFLGRNGNRCYVTGNDYLYGIQSYPGAYTTVRDADITINGDGDWSDQTYFNEFAQERPPNSPLGSNWTFDNGAIKAEAQYNLNEFSYVLYMQDVASVEDSWTYTGDAVTIVLQSTDQTQINEMWMMGKTRTGEWEPVIELTWDGQDQTYGNTVAITKDYEFIGIAQKDSQLKGDITLISADFWRYNSSTNTKWMQDAPELSFPYGYPIDLGATEQGLAYVNLGSLGIGPNTTGSFTTYIANGANIRLSEKIEVNKECDSCSNCDKITLTWLNSIGGYDSYEFNCLESETWNATRVIGDRTLTPNYLVGQRGGLNNYNVAKRSKVVNTNYVTEDVVTSLQQLFMSPDVYEQRSDGTYIPVVIDSTSYSRFVRQDKLKLVQFSYELGYDVKSQVL